MDIGVLLLFLNKCFVIQKAKSNLKLMDGETET